MTQLSGGPCIQTQTNHQKQTPNQTPTISTAPSLQNNSPKNKPFKNDTKNSTQEESGYDGRQADDNGDTALILAAKCGLYKVACRILEHFNDIENNNTILSKPLYIDSRVEDSIFDEAICAKSNLIQIINKQDVSNKSALDYAMERRNYDIACELLLHGASIRSLNRDQQIALLLYSSKEAHNNSSALIEHRLRPVVALLSIKVPEALINYSDDYEYPRLLSYFCYYGHSKVVASLIDSIKNKNRRLLIINNPDNSSTPLNRANDNEELNDNDHLQILKCLFERGASATMNNVDAVYLTLETAAYRGHMETFKYYANRADEKDFNVYIGMAAVGNHLNMLKYLWENYCPSTTTASGETALHYVGEKAKLPCVKYLCENGANVNCINDDGETPLDKAIACNTIDVVKYLVIEHNADVGPNGKNITLRDIKKFLCIQQDVTSINNANGDSLLHEAITYGEMMFIKHLVNQGIDVNKHNFHGITPLHLSAQKPDNEITKFLLQHGAYYDIRSSDNKSVLHVSKNNNTIMLFTINVLFKSSNLFKNMNEAIHSNTAISDAYDQKNPMVFLVSVKNVQRQTLLHKAVFMNDYDAVDLLLKYNDIYMSMTETCKLPHVEDYVALDLSAQDSQGNTPLHLAAENGNFNIVNILLSKHPDLDIKNNAGQTATFVAGLYGHKDIVALLSQRNAETSQQAKTEDINVKIKVEEHWENPQGVNEENEGVGNQTPVNNSLIKVIQTELNTKRKNIISGRDAPKKTADLCILKDLKANVKIELNQEIDISNRGAKNESISDVKHSTKTDKRLIQINEVPEKEPKHKKTEW